MNDTARAQAQRIGVAIAAQRKHRAWNQSELARRAGVRPSYIHRLEAGGYLRPSAERLGRIAEALGCRLADLTDTAAPPLDADLLKQIRRLCDNDELRMRALTEALLALPPEERASALDYFVLGLQARGRLANGTPNGVRS
jgi:transcriptional regulator with XRE-family HTH domain